MTALVQALPQLPEFSAKFSVQDLKEVICTLPLRKARGTDSWSNAELKLLHDDELEMLAALYNQILESGEWPRQLLTAVVALLAKVSCPLTAKDARPITVLPTIYRLFGKVISKKIFSCMAPHLPASLFGSVPGKSAEDAAWALQSHLECAIISGSPMCGVSLDLSKAYNTLPREMIALLADRLGWPQDLKLCYLNFLDGLQRFFKVDQGYLSPTMSSVGVPEGDPIAVPVMIMFTWAFTQLTGEDHGSLVSYVDNWTIMAETPAQAASILHKVKQSADDLTLLLNPSKTKAFATTASDRSKLRSVSLGQAPLEVSHTTHDLGVVFTSTRRSTSTALSYRLRDSESKLRRLQAMSWSSTRKQEVLQRVIAPAVLYGVTFSATSDTLISNIRSKFTAAIWGPHHHRSHLLTPLFSLSKPFEPFVTILASRVKCFRRLFAYEPEHVVQCWNVALGFPKAVGPVTYLFRQLDLFQLHPAADGYVWSQTGCVFNIFQDELQYILLSIQKAWFLEVGRRLEHKPQWSLLRTMDWEMSIMLRAKVKAPFHIVGCFTTCAAMSSAQKRHFLSQEESLCKYCNAEDCPRHRLFECPHYQPCRDASIILEMEQWPSTMTEYGLFRRPTAISDWDRYVHSLPDIPYATFFMERIHIFTDGTTSSPCSIPCSAWAVVLADPTKLDVTCIASGVLPGRQSNYKAELYAVYVAVQHAVQADVFVDNIAVLHGLWRLQQKGWQASFWLKQPEFPLWRKLWTLLESRTPALWTFKHVKSHRAMDAGLSEQQNWEIWYNNQADRCAKEANFNRDHVGKQIHRRALRALSAVTKQAEQVFGLQQNILRQAEQGGRTSQACVAAEVLNRPLEVANIQLPVSDGYADCLLCPPFLDTLHRFIAETTWVSCDRPCSLPELYFCFAVKTGWLVPINIGQWPVSQQPAPWRSTATTSSWIHETSHSNLQLCRQIFSKQCNTFLNALKMVCKKHSIEASFQRSQALVQIGHYSPVSTFPWWPEFLLREPRFQLRTVLLERSFAEFNKRPFAVATSPTPPLVAQPHPTALWNAYCASRRPGRGRA